MTWLCSAWLEYVDVTSRRRVPSMGVARASPAAAVVDGKIYVVGGCDVYDESLSWGEVFDPKTQAWESLPLPRARHRIVHDCVVKDGKIYAVNGVEKTLYYSPREGIIRPHRALKGILSNI